MNEATESIISEKISVIREYKLVIFICGSILTAFGLVLVSMAMYYSSGAAQLDLSRPGYISVRSQASSSNEGFESYPSSGAINQKTIEEFEKLFGTQSQKIQSANVFGGDPLNPEALWTMPSL